MNKNNWNYRGRYEGDWIYHIEDEVLWGATANMVKLFNLNLVEFSDSSFTARYREIKLKIM